jgi:hypothetical protein
MAVDDLNAKQQILQRHGLDAMASFVLVELEVGRTLCNVAKNYENDEKSRGAIEKARKALETAEKYMWKLNMEHSVFDEMTASAERLRFELEALTRE